MYIEPLIILAQFAQDIYVNKFLNNLFTSL